MTRPPHKDLHKLLSDSVTRSLVSKSEEQEEPCLTATQ